jgi:hypothetical protein
MNTVNCVVCKVEVSKRQSLAYQDGRACRTHPEVQVELQRRLAEEEKKRMARIRVHQDQFRRDRPNYHVPQGPECWSCQKPGINAREHWLRMAIAVEKCRLKDKCVFDANLSFEPVRQEYGEVKRVLVLIPVPAEHPLVKNHSDLEMMHSMTMGYLCLCQECAKRNHLEKVWADTLSPEVPEDILKLWHKIAPLMPVNPVIEAVAKAEVIVEQQIVQVLDEQRKSSDEA